MKKTFSLLIVLLIVAIHTQQAQERSLVNTSNSQYSKIHNVDIDATTFTGGFWKERFEVCQTMMVPFMWKIFNDADRSHSFRNFEIAAGLYEGEHNGPSFHDGDFYKWFEGAASIYGVTKDPELDALMDRIIDVIARAQREDGYIHTPVIIRERNNPGEVSEFEERLHFETYNLGHLMTAACVHHRTTGKTTMLNLAIKAADFLYDFFETASAELARNAICPSHYMGVTELYRTTQDEKYLELAKNLIEIRKLVTNGADHNQDRIPFREQTKAMGHAVRANYLYAGVADVVLETGDSTLFKPLDLIWNDLVSSKLYITGGCGALYDGISPDGTTYNQPIIQLIHQAYGRDYQLPNHTAHNESCANIGSMLWNWRMLKLTGEARYGALIEQTLYNSILSAVSLDGKRFFYTNPLAVNHDLPYTLRWSKDREEYIEICNCCPPNVVRTVAQVNNYVYSVSDEAVWCHLFAASHLKTTLPDGSPLEMDQTTNYPWDGDVKFTIREAPGHPLSVKLRIPDWANNVNITINGQAVSEEIEAGAYANLTRNWNPGDEISVSMPLVTRMIQSHPLVEETRNQVAVQRGPLVYCIESPDMPEGYRVFDFALPADATFKPVQTEIDGSPVIALEVEALVLPQQNWDNVLYQDFSGAPLERKTLQLIPHYAWNNRGASEMSVWIPVR